MIFLKFATNDWNTTASEFSRIEAKLDARKRKLAQSLAHIMNAQDATPSFSVLPPVPNPALSEKRVQHAKKGNVRFEKDVTEAVILEFNARARRSEAATS